VPEKSTVLRIDNPHFTIRLYRDLLKIDLKGTLKNEIEEAFENKPVLRQTIGNVLGIFVPLHIHLSDIDNVRADESGKVKIALPRHRDITVPLQVDQARKFVRKLNDLIPEAKRRALLRAIQEQKSQKIGEERLEMGRIGGATFPVLRSSDIEGTEVSEEMAEAEEKEEQKKED
jgi:hypothetical protein